MPKEHRFKTLFNSQDAKGSQTLPKSPRQHFCHILISLLGKSSWEMSLLVISEIIGHIDC